MRDDRVYRGSGKSFIQNLFSSPHSELHKKIVENVDLIAANDVASFRTLRKAFVDANLMAHVVQTLLESGQIYEEQTSKDGNEKKTGRFVLHSTPKNIFTFLAKQPVEKLKALPSLRSFFLNDQLGPLYADKFFVAVNRPWNEYCYNDEFFADSASMSKYHCFLVLKQHDDLLFSNVLFFGLEVGGASTGEGNELVLVEKRGERLMDAIALLREMREAACTFLCNVTSSESFMGWEGCADDYELYFHAYPFNSVTSLHMHIVNTTLAGPALRRHKYKNLGVNCVIRALEDELKEVGVERAKAMQREKNKV